MLPPISVREFARRENCSHTLVQKAIKLGRLKALPDGKLDPALVGTDWRETNRRGGNQIGNPVASVATKGRAKKTAAEAVPVEAIDDAEVEDFVRRALRGEYAGYGEAETVKENGIAIKHMLEARKRAGELVDIDVAKSVLFECARQSRDAWLNFPARVGPLLAADLGVSAEAVIEALNAHVHQQLTELGEPEGDFGANG